VKEINSFLHENLISSYFICVYDIFVDQPHEFAVGHLSNIDKKATLQSILYQETTTSCFRTKTRPAHVALLSSSTLILIELV
jgi:hypothetical protein